MKKISVKNLYLLLVICMGLICLGIGSTYAIFTTSAEIDSPITLVSNLTYDSNIMDTINVKVGAGEMVNVTLNITNSTDYNLNYLAWYLDDGYDINVITYSGASQKTLTSGEKKSIVINVKNKENSAIDVLLGVSSSVDSITLSSNMKQIEDVNFLMNVITEQITSSTFLDSGLTREQISSITFMNNNDIPDTAIASVDVSRDGDRSILLWYGDVNVDGYYDVYIGSDKGKTYIDSGYYLFASLENISSINFNNLVDTSVVSNMQYMFKSLGCNSDTLSLDLDNWDTSSVTDMSSMFYYAGYSNTNFKLDLSKWNVGNVIDMYNMFVSAGQSATTWTIGDLSNWDTSSVTNMGGMLYRAGFNAANWSLGDIGKWDVSNVVSMAYMFDGAGSKATDLYLDLSGWNVSNVDDMQYMFNGVGVNSTTFYLCLNSWNTSNVTNMRFMFTNAGQNATTWSIAGVTDFNTSNVTNMDCMFYYAGYNATNWTLDLSGWSVSNVTSYINFNDGVRNKVTAPSFE